jgi:hypothetical protein
VTVITALLNYLVDDVVVNEHFVANGGGPQATHKNRVACTKEVLTMLAQLMEVYRGLGKILDNPTAYGLQERAPKQLVDALTEIRSTLMHEMRSNTEDPDYDWLAAELSQDADRFCGHRG